MNDFWVLMPVVDADPHLYQSTSFISFRSFIRSMALIIRYNSCHTCAHTPRNFPELPTSNTTHSMTRTQQTKQKQRAKIENVTRTELSENTQTAANGYL